MGSAHPFRLKLVSALLLGVFCLQPVAATDPQSQLAFNKGDYLAAIDKGEQEGTADSLSLACRAALVQGGFIDPANQLTLLIKANNLCHAALKKNPAHNLALVNSIITISFEAKRRQSPSIASRSKRLFTAYMEAAPESAAGFVGLGSWHSEVSKTGAIKKMIMGASKKKAAKYFELAATKADYDLGHHLEALRFIGYFGKPSALIPPCETLKKFTINNALDRLLQNKAQAICAAGNKEDRRKAVIAATAFMTLTDFKDQPDDPAFEAPLVSDLISD